MKVYRDIQKIQRPSFFMGHPLQAYSWNSNWSELDLMHVVIGNLGVIESLYCSLLLPCIPMLSVVFLRGMERFIADRDSDRNE